MQETQGVWVRSLGWEDPLEKEMANHSSILAWKIPWAEVLMGCSPWGRRESDTTEHAHISHIKSEYVFKKSNVFSKILGEI